MRISTKHERWPIAGSFVIAHGAKRIADVVVVTIEHDAFVGRGESTPYPRFGESVEGVIAEIEGVAPQVASAPNNRALLDILGPGAARCAIDAALWDLRAQRQRQPVHQLIGLPPPTPVVTAYTLSVDTPERMAAAAWDQRHRALLKVKLDGTSADRARLKAIHEAAPGVEIIIDPNGSWSVETYRNLVPELASWGVVLVEQPFGEDDSALSTLPRPVPVAADEACRRRETIPTLVDRYDVVNIKLDKAGGLTEACRFADDARAHALGVMIGCHVCTSLSLAPALLLATNADFVDLDAGLLLERDREDGAIYEGSTVSFPALWGTPRLDP